MTEPNKKSPLERALEPLLAEWLSEEDAKAEFETFRPRPEEVSGLLERAVSKCFKPWTLKLMRLQNSWTELVGADIAKKCAVSGVENGIVYLEVRHPAYLGILGNPKIKSLLLGKIRSVLSEEDSRELKFIVSGGRAGN